MKGPRNQRKLVLDLNKQVGEKNAKKLSGIFYRANEIIFSKKERRLFGSCSTRLGCLATGQ